MNNEQFRKLLLANAASSKSKHGPSTSSTSSTSSPLGAKPIIAGSALGSRQRSSMPMTPRSVAGGAQADFARQLAERDQSGRPPSKKFKSSAPRGVRLGQGYIDRTQSRQEMQADERAARLKALEESYRKEEIDKDTYEKARFEIAGGDLESTHLVKGLDFKLLERVRRGEDVYREKSAADDKTRPPEAAEEGQEDVDDEFDQLESKDVQAPEKATAGKQKKKGQLSTVVTGKKRTRDQILAELKAARAAAKTAAASEPALGDRFRKIGTTQKLGTRIERDRKGREVLIIVDADGHEKRKVRKLRPGEQEEEESRNTLPMPDKNAVPLGMEVPEQFRKVEEATVEEDTGDVDIFDDVGDDYNPLAGMDDDSGSDSDEKDTEAKSDTEAKPQAQNGASNSQGSASPDQPPAPLEAPASKAQAGTRNYFQDSKTGLISEEAARGPALSDPAIMAAIKRAATLRRIESEDDAETQQKNKEAEERRKKLLQMAARDDDDVDMGFGTSRLEDEEDFEDHKLAAWADEGGQGGSRGGKPQRKRGPKKRKGDANNAADVLRVMEQRKKS
ncbi:hypothetical protein E4U54_008348 [Claviceps lovelessii]|nr:hypothetical protein E4U54_008348 [Claviceps lovelessii]